MLNYKDIILIENAAIIHQKNKIIDELVAFFARLLEKYKEIADSAAECSSAFRQNGKVSKGEKLNGLPWVTLDYPRSFDDLNGYQAIRTIFWWGNFIKIELLTSKEFSRQVNAALCKSHYNKNYELGFTDHPWSHEKGMLSEDDTLAYFKIIAYYSLSDISNIENALLADFRFFLGLLK
ncbi:hypothetical protein [Polluticaenibacter yanchengensis]|uniref:Uncharacterized protein n=1 Tax=Polluticaenibacter yanchengensis TaxID=3014562 RepID=A0ABT4UI31_9BACT|nr:hypothetical protein [Chitinophagaceae bacterium LY-5]